MQLIGGVFQSAAILSKGQQTANQYEAYEAANKYNEAVLRQRREVVLQTSNAREEQQRRQARIAVGESHAQAAQSGTGTGGSNAEVEHQNEVAAELDALNIRYEGQLAARDLDSEANLQGWEAKLNVQNRNFALRQSQLGAIGAAFGGAAAYGESSGRYGSPPRTQGGYGSDYPRMNYNSLSDRRYS